jgi:predicted RND superfamily exporter protein
MPTTESNWKSRLKSVFNNGYLAFALGVVAGFTIDNWMLILVVALLIWGVQWYTKEKAEENADITG